MYEINITFYNNGCLTRLQKVFVHKNKIYQIANFNNNNNNKQQQNKMKYINFDTTKTQKSTN